MDNRLKELAMKKFRGMSNGGDDDQQKMRAVRPAKGQFPTGPVNTQPVTLMRPGSSPASVVAGMKPGFGGGPLTVQPLPMPRPTFGQNIDPGFNLANRMPMMPMNPNGVFMKNGQNPMATPSASLEELAKKLRMMFGSGQRGAFGGMPSD